MPTIFRDLVEMQQRNNPNNQPVGHFTGRCQYCHSSDLWDDNSAYGCNCCGRWWTGIEPMLVRDS